MFIFFRLERLDLHYIMFGVEIGEKWCLKVFTKVTADLTKFVFYSSIKFHKHRFEENNIINDSRNYIKNDERKVINETGGETASMQNKTYFFLNKN